jgi:hypothetical protein
MPDMTPNPMPDAPASRGPNCWQCRFFGLSYVTAAPYICRAMGFQTRMLPSLEVLRVDGQFCMYFVAKTNTSAV